jgi:hypothetical protein
VTLVVAVIETGEEEMFRAEVVVDAVVAMVVCLSQFYRY